MMAGLPDNIYVLTAKKFLQQQIKKKGPKKTSKGMNII
jgi:hypothetical protein